MQVNIPYMDGMGMICRIGRICRIPIVFFIISSKKKHWGEDFPIGFPPPGAPDAAGVPTIPSNGSVLPLPPPLETEIKDPGVMWLVEA